MTTKPDKITIEPGKYATVVRLHYGDESDLWRKGPYKRERAFASPETATEHARRAFPGVAIGLKANRRRTRRNPDDLNKEWQRVNYEQRQIEKTGDYHAIERAKAETRRVYNEMRMRQLSRNDSRNREGLSYEQWARAAGVGRRSVPGAHAAWIKGKNPVSWSRAYGLTMVANPTGGMDAAEFCAALTSTADLNGKTLWCKHESRLAGERHDTVYLNFINLTPERVAEKRGGGAEAENNRVHLRVEGFARQLGEPPPTGKVKFETLSAYPHKPLRGKTAPPEAMVKYVADYISNIAHTPSNLTHANPAKLKRTSRKSVAFPHTSADVLDLRRLKPEMANAALMEEMRREIEYFRGRSTSTKSRSGRRSDHQHALSRLHALHAAWDRMGFGTMPNRKRTSRRSR